MVGHQEGVGGVRLDFFMSYTQADRAWAEWIAWELHAVAYRVLLQAWNTPPGSNWKKRRGQDGVEQSDRTIAVLSSAYLRSEPCRQERQAAHAADPDGFARKLVPIQVEDCPLPYPFDKIAPFDLFRLDAKADAAYREIVS